MLIFAPGDASVAAVGFVVADILAAKKKNEKKTKTKKGHGLLGSAVDLVPLHRRRRHARRNTPAPGCDDGGPRAGREGAGALMVARDTLPAGKEVRTATDADADGRTRIVVACELAGSRCLSCNCSEKKKKSQRCVGRRGLRGVHAPQREQTGTLWRRRRQDAIRHSARLGGEIESRHRSNHCLIFIQTRNCSIMNNGDKVGKSYRFSEQLRLLIAGFRNNYRTSSNVNVSLISKLDRQRSS